MLNKTSTAKMKFTLLLHTINLKNSVIILTMGLSDLELNFIKILNVKIKQYLKFTKGLFNSLEE